MGRIGEKIKKLVSASAGSCVGVCSGPLGVTRCAYAHAARGGAGTG